MHVLAQHSQNMMDKARRMSSNTLKNLKSIEHIQDVALGRGSGDIALVGSNAAVLGGRSSNTNGLGGSTGSKRGKRSVDPKSPHVPKVDIKTRHQVILFGRIYKGMDTEEEKLYSFTHQRADGEVSEGYIPVGFLSMLPVEDENLFLAIRKSPMGPEFQVAHKTEGNVICEWDLNPDAMWANVVTMFDKRDIFSEATMDYLDADPFVLFGIDDLITQKTLRKLEKFPVLLCRGAKPDSEEWFTYLELNSRQDKELDWIVQSFAEVEIPAPWTSYKG